MSINVNVSVEELRRFADYVGNFKKYVDGDCAQLQNAISVLAATMDSESVALIASTVDQISKILTDEGPAIATLEEKVRNYADFVARLKAAASH